MAQDFIALIEGRADLQKAKSDFDSFKTSIENNPIKLKFDTSGFTAAWNNIQNAFNQQGKNAGRAFNQGFQSNLSNINVSKSVFEKLIRGFNSHVTGIAQPTVMELLGADSSVTRELSKELDSILQKGTQLTKLRFNGSGTSFTATAINDMGTLITLTGKWREAVTDAQGAVKKQAGWDIGQSFATNFAKGTQEAQTQAKKLASDIQKITESFATGKFNTNLVSMSADLNNYANTSSAALNKMQMAYKEYEAEVANMRSQYDAQGNVIDDQALIAASERAKLAFDKYKNALKEVRAEEKSTVSAEFANQKANEIEKWANQNSKALREYGDQLKQLASDMRKATTSGEVNRLTDQFKALKAEIGAKGLTGSSFFADISRAFKRIGEFTGIYKLTSELRRIPEQMVKSVIQIDTAMTELRKVSTASAQEITQYFDKAAESAAKYGQTIDEVVNSTASWTRLGYNLRDATILTDVTSELAQVGSGLNVSSATEGLQSIMRGFGFAADEAKRIGDVVNEVADTQPITASGIIEGLERSSSALREANNTLEESVALITASTSVTQDALSAGTAWRTIALRIRGAKTELESMGEDTDGMAESVSKLREEVLSLSGVDIMEVDGSTFKSTYKIIEELSRVYSSLSDVSQANLLELLGGKRGAVPLAAALQNMSVATSTKETALSAEGSMDRQLEIYNKSVQASINRFKVAFQKLSVDFLNSNFLKGIIDTGTKFVEILDVIVTKIGSLETILAGGAIFKFLSSFGNLSKLGAITRIASGGLGFLTGTTFGQADQDALNELMDSLAGLDKNDAFKALIGAGVSNDLAETIIESSDATGVLNTQLLGTGRIAGTLGTKFGKLTDAISGIGSTMMAHPFLAIGGIVAASALVAYTQWKKQQEELIRQASEATQNWTSDKGNIDSYISRYEELQDRLEDANLTERQRIEIKKQLLDLQGEITSKYGDQLKGIDLVNGKLETQRDILRGISAETANNNINNNLEAYKNAEEQMKKVRTYSVTGSQMGGGAYNRSLLGENLIAFNSIYEAAGFRKNGYNFKFTGDATEANEAISEVITNLREFKETLEGTDAEIVQNAIDSAVSALQSNNKILDKYQANYKAYVEQSLYAEGFGDELSEYARLAQEYNNALISGNTDEIIKARDAYNEYGITIDGIIKEHEEFSEIFGTVTESVDIASEKLFDFKDILEDGVATAGNTFSEYTDQMVSSFNKIKSLKLTDFDIQDIFVNGKTRAPIYGDLLRLAKLWNEDFDITNTTHIETFADGMYQIGLVTREGVDEASESIDAFLLRLSGVIARIDEVNSALVHSFASGGLTASIDEKTNQLAGDVATLMIAYRNLDSYDPSKLFERTAAGIIVNKNELRSLQAEQEKALKTDLVEKRKELVDDLAEATKNLSNAQMAGEDTSQWVSQINLLQDNITQLDLLSSAYDGATSAYQKWLDAQNGGESGDMYDAVAKTALKRGEELREAGLVGTNEFRAIAQLYSNEDLTGASIDEIVAAYDAGVDVVKKYFTEGQEGAVAFADKLVELGEATKDAQGNYDFSEGIDTQKIADDLGISVDLVESAFKKLDDYGFDVHFHPVVEDGDLQLAIDSAAALQARIQQLDQANATADVKVDVADDATVQALIENIMNLPPEIKTELNIDADDTYDEVLQKFQNGEITLPVTPQINGGNAPFADVAPTVDYSALQNLPPLEMQVNPLFNEEAAGRLMEGLDLTAEVTMTANTDEPDAYASEDHDIPAEVVYGVNHNEVDKYRARDLSIPSTVDYSVAIHNTSALDNLPKDGEHRTVYIDTVEGSSSTTTSNTTTKKGGLFRLNGTVPNSAFRHFVFGGNSHARGVALTQDENALINEIGPEIVVRPSEDSWMIYNGGMPTMGVPLRKGDIVFNSEQTEKLLKNGWVDSYGHALAGGTIKGVARRTVTGSGSFYKEKKNGNGSNSGNGGSNSGNGGSGGGGNDTSKANDKAEEFLETLDEIEIKIDRIEREISNLDTIASNTFYNWNVRNNALVDELSRVSNEIEIQRQGYARYLQQANAVGLDEEWASKVREGRINIEDVTDEDLWDKIESYRKWYEAALDCRDAIQGLMQTEGELWSSRFNLDQTWYENEIGWYDHENEVMDTMIDTMEARGRILSDKYYKQQAADQRNILKQQKQEREYLINDLNKAVASGAVDPYSEGWYEMKNQIDQCEQSIYKTENAIAKLNKSIRELRWENFDYAMDTIGGINDEVQFLYGLFDEDKMYDSKGHITDQGLAGLGLQTQSYDMYLQEAKRYGAEIKKVNAELAKDPYNKDIIDRQKELYKAQQDAINGANKQKEAISKLVEDGIKKQVESLKDLISAYEEALDAEKEERDYAKKVAQSQKQINNLQKQLNAYSRDNTEEGAARRQQLRNQLKDAQNNLAETQEDRRIAETKKMLQQTSEQYEEVLNSRLDNIDALVAQVVKEVNSNSVTVRDAISTAAADVGYNISSPLDTALANTSIPLATISGNSGTIATAVNSILAYLKTGEKKADTEAKKDTEKVSTPTTPKAGTGSGTGGSKTTQDKIIAGTNTGDKAANNNSATANSGTGNYGINKAGWNRDNKGWWYINKDGSYSKNTIQKIDGKYYHFDKSGYMSANKWVKSGKDWYYAGESGALQTGWQNLKWSGGQDWFLFNSARKMLTGRQKVNGKTYILDTKTGAMKKNGWSAYDDHWYYLDNTGAAMTGWQKLSWSGGKPTDWFFFNKNGAMLTGLQTIDKKKYYLDPTSGAMLANNWKQVGKKWYYFGGSGAAMSGWQELNWNNKKSWYYFDPSTNEMKANEWFYDPNYKAWFWLNSDGSMAKNGTFKTKNGNKKFDASGRLLNKNGKIAKTIDGLKKGAKSVSADGLYWTNEYVPETIIRKSDGAVLTKLNAGDTVLNGKATQNMWDFSNNPQRFLNNLIGAGNRGGNNVSMEFNLSGLKDPSDFMNALLRDKRFTRIVQELTIGQVAGHGKLAKNAL